MTLRPYISADWPAVEEITWQGIKTGTATFDTKPRSKQAFEATALAGSVFVSTDPNGNVTGWACLWPTSARACYRGVAEGSVYVAEAARGNGLGLLLLEKLNAVSEAMGIWTLQAAISTQNRASIKIHEKAGYRAVGVREKIAELKGVWGDTLLMERRSRKVGYSDS